MTQTLVCLGEDGIEEKKREPNLAIISIRDDMHGEKKKGALEVQHPHQKPIREKREGEKSTSSIAGKIRPSRKQSCC